MIPTEIELLWAGVAVLLFLTATAGVFIFAQAFMGRISTEIGHGVTPADRAELLLRDVLEESEYQQLTKRGYFDLRSPSDPERIYRIPRYCGLVRMYEHGVVARELCVQPVEPLPTADTIAMHKMMIQGNEEEYLACARKYMPMYPKLRYRP